MKKIVALLLVVSCLLSGCALAGKTEKSTVFCMDTVMELQVTGENRVQGIQEVTKLLRQLEQIWSYTDADSTIYKMNAGDFSPEQPQREIIDKAEALSRRTGGALNLRLGAVSEVWGFRDGAQKVPTQDAIDAALAQKKWDMGAVIKGYAGQEAAELLENIPNIDCAILNLGGNVQTVGEKPGGQPWKIGIQNPAGGTPLGTISVTGTASIVTSGDYQRYFEKDGVRYHHIMDPETGRPAQSALTSVTVIARDGLTADALSTALFVMGLEQGSAFWRESDDFEAVFVQTDGKIYATEGAMLSDCSFEVIGREK